MAKSIDPLALKGFSDAHTYDAHRPSYPPQAVDQLRELLPHDVGRPFRILDLAAGTGKFTEVLARNFSQCDIKAVEPHPRMREVLEKKAIRGVDVVDGTAREMTAISDCWADVVVVAQAFHWFADADSLREMYRTVVPGGLLFLLWNESGTDAQTLPEPATRWEAEMRNLAMSFRVKQRGFFDARWREIFNNETTKQEDGSFSPQTLFDMPLKEKTIKWSAWLTKQDIWDGFSTLSFITSLDDEEKEDVKKRLLDILEKGDVETDEAGKIEMRGNTNLVWTFKKSPSA
ncbi:MAG: hypothetical protein Q9160_009122 [Pyrenula sp. 1 TL-2023]